MNLKPSTVVAALQRLQAWNGLVRLQTLLDGIRKLEERENFFRIVPRVVRVEGVHSDIVFWLLNPKGWHSLGDRFACRLVRKVLTACGQSADLPIEIEEVHKEYSTGRGPIDLLLRVRLGAKRLVVGIENKIDSPDAPAQLCRYADGLLARFGADNVLLAFLTLDGLEPNAEPPCPLACVSYQALADCLDDAVRSAADLNREESIGLQLARHYLEMLRVDVMREPNPEIEAICKELYEKHPDAWQTIRRLLPSERDELLKKLGVAACTQFQVEFGGEWQFSVRRDKYTRVYRPSWRKLGLRKDDPIIGWEQLVEEQRVDWCYAEAHLRLYISDLPEVESADQYEYKVGLKVDTRDFPAHLSTSVVDALKREGFGVPERDQFTIPIKSKSKLPSVGDKPDTVLDWMLPHVRRAVATLDSVLVSTPSASA